MTAPALALVSSQSREELRKNLIADLRLAAQRLARLEGRTSAEVLEAALFAEQQAAVTGLDVEEVPW